jgi:hypothetical protein
MVAAQDVATIQSEPGHVVYCCGQPLSPGYRLYERKKAADADQAAIAAKLEELTDWGERPPPWIAVNEKVEMMPSTGDLQEINKAFKEARKPSRRSAMRTISTSESGDAGGPGARSDPLQTSFVPARRAPVRLHRAAAWGTKIPARLLRGQPTSNQRRKLCLESRRSKKAEGRSRRRPRSNHTSPLNTSKRPHGWPVHLSPTRIRKGSARRKIRCRLLELRGMIGFLRQLRRAIARSRAPDVLIAILAATLAWFITALLRAAIGSY